MAHLSTIKLTHEINHYNTLCAGRGLEVELNGLTIPLPVKNLGLILDLPVNTQNQHTHTLSPLSTQLLGPVPSPCPPLSNSNTTTLAQTTTFDHGNTNFPASCF